MKKKRTITEGSEAVLKEKGSKFIAIAFPFTSESDLKDVITECKDRYPKASHYCYAYRIGTDGTNFRANDDGEPNGTAGNPILNQIDSTDITDVIIVVIRYFGGTKMGVPGLISAYKKSAKQVIETLNIIEIEETSTYKLVCSYNDVHETLKVLNRNQFQVTDKTFGEQCSIIISLNSLDESSFLQLVENLHSLELIIHKLEK